MDAELEVLDTWAVLVFLQGEQPAASRVLEVLESGRAVMSWVNIGEAAYIIERRHGRDAANETVDDLRARLASAVDADADLARQAARIKAAGGMSYADAFAAATASMSGAVLLTGDPELLGPDRGWRTEDLRNA